MFGRIRRLREALADEKALVDLLRHQLGEVSQERDSWKWAATRTMRSHDDTLIQRTRERDTARIKLLTVPRDAAMREVAEQKATADRYAKLTYAYGRRLHRALRACARYRQDAARQAAVADRLSDQLLDAIGYAPELRARLDNPAAALTGEQA